MGENTYRPGTRNLGDYVINRILPTTGTFSHPAWVKTRRASERMRVTSFLGAACTITLILIVLWSYPTWGTPKTLGHHLAGLRVKDANSDVLRDPLGIMAIRPTLDTFLSMPVHHLERRQRDIGLAGLT